MGGTDSDSEAYLHRIHGKETMHKRDGLTSKVESKDSNGQTLYDYHTAHEARDDPEYQLFLPGFCSKCTKQAFENPAAVSPDEEFLNAAT